MIVYLSRAGVAKRIGVAVGTLARYKLPAPDAMIGTSRGWLPETIDAWNASRPGSGNWRKGDIANSGAYTVTADTEFMEGDADLTGRTWPDGQPLTEESTEEFTESRTSALT